jgi:hypothetical protein
MSDSAQTNWTELSQQVADLQVKAFLRIIFEMGEVLDNNGHAISNSSPALGRGKSVDHESTGAGRKLVTSITDSSQTNGLLSRERTRNPSGSQECLEQNQRGERLHDEEQTSARTAHDGALAKTEETSAERKRSRKTDRNP